MNASFSSHDNFGVQLSSLLSNGINISLWIDFGITLWIFIQVYVPQMDMVPQMDKMIKVVIIGP